MKIDRQAFGFAPLSAPVVSVEEPQAAGFGKVFRVGRGLDPVGWRTLLRLDIAPAGQAAVMPPPEAAGASDAGPKRLRLRRLVLRHTRLLEHARGEASHDDLRAIVRMLAVLRRHQQLEDAILARQLAEAREE